MFDPTTCLQPFQTDTVMSPPSKPCTAMLLLLVAQPLLSMHVQKASLYYIVISPYSLIYSKCCSSPSFPKDKFVINVINPYLTEVRTDPQVLHVEDGVL